MPMSAQWQRDRRVKLREQGICTRCQVADAADGHTTCRKCFAHLVDYRRKRRSDPANCCNCFRKRDKFSMATGGQRCIRCADLVNNQKRRERARKTT